MRYEIPFIEGDGVGADIWPVAQELFDEALRKSYGEEHSITWLPILAGEAAFNATRSYLPEETLQALRTHKVAIKGPLGTPTGGGHRSLNVALRQEFDLYACVRPVRYFPGVPSPLRHPEAVDLTIFRENTEDIYSGIEWDAGSDDATRLIDILREDFGVTNLAHRESTSLGLKPISEEGSKRLIRAAFDYALETGRSRVTLVHKGNIQKFTEGGFRRWGYELAALEYADAVAGGALIVDDIIADNFFQQVLLNPGLFDVVALTNLNGDYASDAVAAQVGGIGIAPGANINYETGHALFEATHGTAPDIAGLGLANPCSLLLSGAMMFKYLGLHEAAYSIENGVMAALVSQKMTGDFASQLEGVEALSTQAFGQAVKDFL